MVSKQYKKDPSLILEVVSLSTSKFLLQLRLGSEAKYVNVYVIVLEGGGAGVGGGGVGMIEK